MTAHVAERGEGRGRVVLRLDCAGHLNEAAVDAAIIVAKAFGAGIESLLVEDRQVFDAAGYDFTREIAPGNAGERRLAVEDMARSMALAARAAGRRIAELGGRADVPIEVRCVRDTPIGALVDACQSAGPWNVVTLGEPLSAATLARLDGLFERVTGMTGIVVAGRGVKAKRQRTAHEGPIVAIVEHPERLAGMIRTASRIAHVLQADVIVALLAPSRAAMTWLVEEVRGASGIGGRVMLAELAQPGGGVAVVAESLRRIGASFVIAELGGLALPAGEDLRPLVGALDCPLLVVR